MLEKIEALLDESNALLAAVLKVDSKSNPVKYNKRKANNQDLAHFAIEIIAALINNFMVDKRARLQEINHLSSNTTAKLLFRHQEELECSNHRLEKRAL